MKKSVLIKILLCVTAAVCLGLFIVRLAAGASIITAGLWIAACVFIVIIAFAINVKEEKAVPALVGSLVTLTLGLMIFSFVLGQFTATGRTAQLLEQLAEAYATDAAVIQTQPSLTPSQEPMSTPRSHISWTEKYYVDDFNDPTNVSYLSGRFIGTFSNSATSDSLLYAYLIFDKDLSGKSSDLFRIKLYEYGDYIVNYNIIDTKDVEIKIKIDGSVFSAHPDLLTENEIYIKRGSSIFSRIIIALNKGKEISVVITESKYSTSTYRFTIDSNGLDDIAHNWKG